MLVCVSGENVAVSMLGYITFHLGQTVHWRIFSEVFLVDRLDTRRKSTSKRKNGLRRKYLLAWRYTIH